MDGQEGESASGLSWGKLSVEVAPLPIPRLKPSEPWPLGFGGGPFRAALTLHCALFRVTLLGRWVYSVQDVCKSNSPHPHPARSPLSEF